MFKFWNFFLGVVIGGLISAVTAFSHSDRIVVSGTIVRYGFFLAMLLIVLTQLWSGRYSGSRMTTFGFAVAWIVVTVWFGMGTNDNDMSLPDGGWSTAYVAGGSLLVAFVASVPVLRHKSHY